MVLFSLIKGLPRPVVQLTSASVNSLHFSWNELPVHCVNIQVSYEYELQLDNVILQNGSVLNSGISFNGLDSGTRYRLRVRVSAVSSNVTRRSSWSSYAYGRTTSVKAPTTQATTAPIRSSLPTSDTTTSIELKTTLTTPAGGMYTSSIWWERTRLTLVLLRGGCTNPPNGSRPGAQNRTAKG